MSVDLTEVPTYDMVKELRRREVDISTELLIQAMDEFNEKRQKSRDEQTGSGRAG